MDNKAAKIKYKANSFEIIKPGDYVYCGVTKKKIPLEKLTYWNVDLQEPYFSPKEVKIRYEEIMSKNFK